MILLVSNNWALIFTLLCVQCFWGQPFRFYWILAVIFEDDVDDDDNNDDDDLRIINPYWPFVSKWFVSIVYKIKTTYSGISYKALSYRYLAFLYSRRSSK